MADIKSQYERSLNMARIHSKDTKPEEYVRKALFKKGYRYRKHSNRIVGHPDAWLAKHDTALFVNGCFWHRHAGCKYAYEPKSREQFWNDKFQRNVLRDETVKQELLNQGIRILVIWECTVKRMMRSVDYENEMITKVENFINSNDTYMEL